MAAGDFYFAINATFRFILERHGKDALVAYWRTLGQEHYAPLTERFRAGGLEAVEAYWREFLAREPGGEFEVTRGERVVEVDIRVCPAIAWLRAHGREITPGFCEHCRHVAEPVAHGAGMRFELEGGEGSCRQRYSLPEEAR